MGKRIWAGLLAVAAFTATLSVPARGEEWRVQTLFAPGTLLYESFSRMAENVKAATGGKLVIKPLPVGAAIGPTGTLDAVKSGVLDGHYTWPGLWGGIEVGFVPLADLAGAYEAGFQQFEFMESFGGLALLRELYEKQGLFTVGVAFNGVESLPARKAIRGVADLSGLKIRMPPGLAAMALTKLGAAPVNLPMSEAFSAIDKGVVDAADNGSLGDNLRQGLHESAKFALFPGFHSAPVLDFSVNRRKWEAQPPETKRILEGALREMAAVMLSERARDDAAAAEEARTKKGVTLVNWSADERRKYRVAAREAWEEFAKRGPQARRAIDLQIAYLKAKGLLD